MPRRAAGVYTVWREDAFIYVGMSGRGAQREDFVAQSGQSAAAKGLWTRLNSLHPADAPATSSTSISATGSSFLP